MSDQDSLRMVGNEEQMHAMQANQEADPVDVELVLQAQREDEVCQEVIHRIVQPAPEDGHPEVLAMYKQKNFLTYAPGTPQD